MNKIAPKSVFMSEARVTLADVRVRVDQHLTGSKRRDRLSALDTFARVKKLEPDRVLAHPKVVRQLLQEACAAELGLSETRWRNVRSAVVASVRDFGERLSDICTRMPINDGWQAYLDRVLVKHHRQGLHRLARYCSALQISPNEVGKETLLDFYDALVEEELVLDPRKKIKHTIAVWNMCGRQVHGWPDTQLSSPFEQDIITFKREAFPKAFLQDLERWKKRLLEPDPLDPKALVKPLSVDTVKGKEAMLLRFASALVRSHVLSINDITEISTLFRDLETFKAGLRFFLARTDNQPTGNIAKIADNLRGIAKYYGNVPEAQLEEMTAICKRLRPPRQAGMSPKNRTRLAQFDDPANVDKLIAFPAEEVERGRQLKNPYRTAKCFERALAVSLLLATSLRIKSLRTIVIESDISFVGGRCFLSLPAERVKNRVDLDFELPDDTANILREYLATHRNRFPGSDGPYLFPGKDSGPRPASTMANGLKETLKKRSGLTMNPHLFRHAVAKIVVERDPGLAMVVSRHLGHKRFDTTMMSYLGSEGRASARNIDKILRQGFKDA